MKGKAKAWPQSAELSCKLWAPAVRREALESPREAVSLRQHLTLLLESWAGNRCGARVIKHWGCFGVYYYSRLNPRKQFSFLPSPLTLKILLFLRAAILELWALQFLLFSLSFYRKGNSSWCQTCKWIFQQRQNKQGGPCSVNWWELRRLCEWFRRRERVEMMFTVNFALIKKLGKPSDCLSHRQECMQRLKGIKRNGKKMREEGLKEKSQEEDKKQREMGKGNENVTWKV